MEPIRLARVAAQKAADEAAAAQAAKDAADAIERAKQAYVAPQAVAAGPIGNNYDYGSCAYYVASRIAVPTSMGNANNWDAGLLSAGWHQGLPVVGAIAQTDVGYYGHVAIVTAIGIGVVQITEMNAAGWNMVDSRWVALTDFKYFTK